MLDKIEAYLEKLNKENIGKRKEKNKYKYKTANGNYTNIINKIAVINIKKLGSGKYCNTKLSEMGCTFEEYLKNTDICEILHRQIEIIDPTVIIVCGKGMWDSVNKAIKLSDLSYSKDGHKVICIESYHPSYVKSDIDHCKYIIENYRAAKK